MTPYGGMAKLTFELYKFVLPYVIAKERSDCGNLNPYTA
jgi:hypothetical protein